MKKLRLLIAVLLLALLAGCSSAGETQEDTPSPTPEIILSVPETASPESYSMILECRIDRFYHSGEISHYRTGELQMRRDIDGDGEEEYIFFSGASSMEDPTNIVFYYDRIDGEYYSADLYSMLADALGRLNFSIRMQMANMSGSSLPFLFKNQNTDRLIRGEFRFTPVTVEVWSESSLDIVPQPEDDFRSDAIRWANEMGYVEEIPSLFKTIAGESFCIPVRLPQSFDLYQERLVRYDPLTDSYTAARLWYDRESRSALLIAQRPGNEEEETASFVYEARQSTAAPWALAEARCTGNANGVYWESRAALSDENAEDLWRGIMESVQPVKNPFIW